MKHRKILLPLMLMLTLTGCTKGVETDYAAPDLGIMLTAKDVTPAGMTVVCTQSGGEVTGELNTGSWYRLESMDGKELDYVVEGDAAWTSEACIVFRNAQTEWAIDWTWLYGELPPGDYRICKEFMDFRGAGDFDRALAYAEFTVE